MKPEDKTNNFTVSIRIKPTFPSNPHNQHISYKTINHHTLLLSNHLTPYAQQKNRKFTYDTIFESESNNTIFQQIIKPKLNFLDKNYNLTIFTYGVTGSGKTYTVFGDQLHQKEQGVALLAFSSILDNYKGQKKQYSFSYLQIYNEQVNDLLNNEQITDNKLKSLQVLEDVNGNTQIPELTKCQIQSIHEIKQLIHKGNNLRACSSNMINKLSSRSHAILQLNIINQNGQENTLTVIDLAGSEKIPITNGPKSSDENTLLQKQGSNINKSLLSLANCIKCLQQNKNSHIPYRDSKLTRILKTDLSGRAHNIMIACIGREISQIQQTINTLQYASRAKKIQVEMKQGKNEKTKFYFCQLCGQGVSWETIVNQIPHKLMNSKRDETCEGENKSHPVPYNINLMTMMSNFRSQIMQTLTNQLSLELIPKSKDENQENSDLTYRSNISNLFDKSYNDQFQSDISPSLNLQLNKIMSKIKLSLNDIFESYENQFTAMFTLKNIEKQKQQVKFEPSMSTKINLLFEPQKATGSILKSDDLVLIENEEQCQYKKIRTKSQNDRYRINKRIDENGEMEHIRQQTEYCESVHENNIQMREDKYLRKTSPLLSFPSLEEEREALLFSEYRKSSNLRRKLSIKSKKSQSHNATISSKLQSLPQTANTTALDSHGFTNFSKQNILSEHGTQSPLVLDPIQLQEYFNNQRSHRMNPDAQSDEQQLKITTKEAIIKKLANARHKSHLQCGSKLYNYPSDIEVSSFELDIN